MIDKETNYYDKEKEMIIHIFTIATGEYNLYLEYQFKSVKNLFPNIKKTYNVISDMKPDFKMIDSEDVISKKYYKLIKLPSHFVSLNKFSYCIDMYKENNYDDNDYFIFVDPDTIFCNKSKCKVINIWDILIDNLSKGLNYAIHPNIFDRVAFRDNEVNRASISYINNINQDNCKNYCQASFMMGRISDLKALNDKIQNLISIDMNHDSQCQIIASSYELQYVNKVIYELSNNITFVGRKYIHNNSKDICIYKNPDGTLKTDYHEYEKWLSPYCICMQRFK